MASKNKFTLTLKSKVELIKCHDDQNATVKFLAAKYKCGKTQVYDILKNKEKIKSEWLSGNYSGDAKRKLRKTGNEEINKILYQWFLDARARNLPISGPILQEQGKLIAQRLGKNDFKASNGWLESFRSRYDVSLKQVCGEAKDVDLSTVDDWKLKLSELIENCGPENIGNCDETGLFFKALPSKTLTLKKEKCVGGKQPKERLTVLLCGFADGYLEKPLVIGKSFKPRCFKNLSVDELPVIWRANKKAWMTSAIMEEWLKALNRKMIVQKRRILLFLDNAACHPRIDLSNINLVFFPPNTTSLTQPMDQGVIQNMKMHYRKLVLQSLCANISSCNSVTELSKKISVLDAIRWISTATKSIKKQCVAKCFKHAGFEFETNSREAVDSQEDELAVEETNALPEQDLREIQSLIESLGENLDIAEEFVKVDEALSTEGGYQSLDDLIEATSNSNQEEDNDEDEGQGLATEMEREQKIKSFADALKTVSALEDFAERTSCNEIATQLLSLRTVMEQNAPRLIKQQKTLTELWKHKN